MADTNNALDENMTYTPTNVSLSNTDLTTGSTPNVSAGATSGSGGGMSTGSAVGVGAGIGGLLGGMLTSGQTNADISAAQAAYNNALNNYSNINVPTAGSMKVNLAQYLNQGGLNPSAITAAQQGGTQLNTVTTDPRLMSAQMAALGQMQQLSNTGTTAIDQAAIHNLLNQTSAQNMAQQKSILANRQARGMGGAGDELAAELQGSQSASNQASNNAMGIAAQAMQNRMAAINQSANMGQSIQQQQYNQLAAKARAQDVINQYNTQNQQGVNVANTNAINQAQASNLANAQNLANSNVGISNQQQLYNTGLNQQQYEDALQKASGQAGVAGGIYNSNIAAANASAQQGSNEGQALGSLAALALV